MRREMGLAAAIVLVLAAGVAVSADRSKLGKTPGQGPSGGKKPVRVQVSATAAEQDPGLMEAAKTAPIPPETLARVLPKRAGVFSVKNVSPSVRSVGPAMAAEVRADLEGQGERRGQLLLIDWAGLRPDSDLLAKPSPTGKREEAAGVVREGLLVLGFPAVREDTAASHESRAQIKLTDRLHLTLKGTKVNSGDLLDAARAIDLKALAALVPAKQGAGAQKPAGGATDPRKSQ